MKRSQMPSGLSKEAQKFFRETRDQYDIGDAPSLMILGNAARALDRLRKAESIVAAEGAVYKDRWGQPKSHPAANRMDSENQTFLRSVRELGINLAPLGDRDRPPAGI